PRRLAEREDDAPPAVPRRRRQVAHGRRNRLLGHGHDQDVSLSVHAANVAPATDRTGPVAARPRATAQVPAGTGTRGKPGQKPRVRRAAGRAQRPDALSPTLWNARTNSPPRPTPAAS